MSDDRLTELGIAAGEEVRFRRDPRRAWRRGHVTGRERDGSLAIVDDRGRARAIPIEAVEVRTEGPRGGAGWEPVRERADRTEQLRLL